MDSYQYHEMQAAKTYNRIMRPVYIKYAEKFRGHFLTLASSVCLPVSEFHNLVREFHKRLDRALLGRNYYKKERGERTQGIMFLEQITSHIHGHALVNFAGNKTEAELQNICHAVWKEVCPGGEVSVKRQAEKSPARYATKEFENLEHDDLSQVILFKDFVSK